eukprot:CAMPEP_0202075224 /NCGR_PEP_ID=MMETSP0964-20121228/4084_1 /ASSEMBLY_ACC=CAM_ASM_000500 /TAXON_ID=4773 /ORGANISM="Schizochytrium aggregatum, Strain ATCC28209" /LENGTH=83 /DNA_ID=CAMNT_0048642407 /DNA_START=287 /DNA_END=535 /DNA_ORIENTATION=-
MSSIPPAAAGADFGGDGLGELLTLFSSPRLNPLIPAISGFPAVAAAEGAEAPWEGDSLAVVSFPAWPWIAARSGLTPPWACIA